MQTANRYDRDYRRFFEDNEFAQMDIRKADAKYIRNWCKSLVTENKLTSKAWMNVHGLIRGTFLYAIEQELTDFSISSCLADLKLNFAPQKKDLPGYDETQVYTDDEVKKIVEQMQGTIIDDGIKLVPMTGLRVGELSSLKWEDVAEDFGSLTVQRTEIKFEEDGQQIIKVRKKTKGRYQYRTVILTDEASELLKTLKATSEATTGYIFERDGERVKNHNFPRRLETLCRRAGIQYRSMHKLRKTCISKLIDSGLSHPAIQAQVGHTDFRTTESFYHFNRAEMNETRETMNRSLAI